MGACLVLGIRCQFAHQSRKLVHIYQDITSTAEAVCLHIKYQYIISAYWMICQTIF